MDIAKKGKLENKMGTMPINKLIINMSLPLITSMFVQAFYNIVDSLFVARINEEALTAVSMSFPAQNLMISAGTGVGVGITALIARYLGAKDEKGVTRVVHNGIFLGILNSILFAIFGLFFAKFYFEFLLLASFPVQGSYPPLHESCFYAFYHNDLQEQLRLFQKKVMLQKDSFESYFFSF